jgi:hypothetical protein
MWQMSELWISNIFISLSAPSPHYTTTDPDYVKIAQYEPEVSHRHHIFNFSK